MAEIDFAADAAYIYLPGAKGRHVKRTTQITASVSVDEDEDYCAVGVEVLGLKSDIPFRELADRYYNIPDETFRELFSLSSASLRHFFAGAGSGLTP